MKYVGLLFCLLAVGCTHYVIPTPPPQDKASVCNSLYEHILELVLTQDIYQFQSTSPEEKVEARRQLDVQYIDDGTSTRFYDYCMRKMTYKQVSCAFQATSLGAMNLCNTKDK